MKKLLTFVSIALFGAVVGFACGGGQKPAAESTTPTADEATEPAAADTEAAPAEGGDSYGGAAYGDSADSGGDAL